MKIKTSHTRSFALFGACFVIVFLLLSLKSVTTKSDKYSSSPKAEQITSLDFIQITFNQKNYNKIKKKRRKALSIGILETNDADYVPAIVSFNGKDFKAEVRLKGDWIDHLEGDKWSFRVKLKDDKTILGMRKFSIHHPQTRGNINEWLYHKAIKDEEIIGLRYGFVEAKVHIKLEGKNEFITKDTGLYAIEETFDKRTIESNKRKESVILKFSEDYWWNEVKKSIETGAAYNKRWNSFMNSQLNLLQKCPITTFSEEKVMADSTMRNYFKLGKNLLVDLRAGKTTIDKVIDVKKLAMQNAILNLFGAIHGTYSINLRFYYNPITSKLEPMAFDGNSGVKLTKYEHFIFLDEKKDSIYLKELAKALNKVSKKEYLDNLLKTYRSDIKYYEKQLKTEFQRKLVNPENLAINQNILKQEMLRIKRLYNLEDIAVESSPSAELSEIKMPPLENWLKKGVRFTKESNVIQGQSIYKVMRQNDQDPAYVNINNIAVNFGQRYKVTVKVKNSSPGNIFGLRVQGIYPNRADAIFDLKAGKKDATNAIGYFENENVTMTPLNNGWYECSLTVTANTDKVSIIFGPTDASKTVTGWEGKSDVVSGILITEPKIEIVTSNL